MKSPSKIRPENDNRVSVSVKDEQVILSEWCEIGVPTEEAIDKLEFHLSLEGKAEKKKLRLTFTDSMSHIQYAADAEKNDDSTYFIGVQEDNELNLYPICYFKAKPLIQGKSKQVGLTEKSRRELLDELNETFGSKKSKKQVEMKRKFAIDFKEEDLETSGYNPEKMALEQVNLPEEASKASSEVDIVPSQNASATCVQEVYNLDDIVDKETLSMFDDKSLVKTDFVKGMLPKCPTEEEQTLAGFLSGLILMVNLRYTDLRKQDPLPDLENEKVKEYLLERYTTTTELGRTKKRSIVPKQRDQLLIHALIINLHLNHFRDILIEDATKAFKVQARQLKKISEFVGFHQEKKKNAQGINVPFLVFKLPLFKPQSTANKRKRRY